MKIVNIGLPVFLQREMWQAAGVLARHLADVADQMHTALAHPAGPPPSLTDEATVAILNVTRLFETMLAGGVA